MSDLRISEGAAEAAAKWWAEAIAGDTWDNGEPTHNLMIGLLRSKEPIFTQESYALFVENLKAILLQHNPYYLRVDYHPDGYLAEAAQRAGLKVNDFGFPAKTTMRFEYNGTVTASLGYRGDWVYVYGLEIAQREWDVKTEMWMNSSQEYRNIIVRGNWREELIDCPASETLPSMFGKRPE